MARSLIVFGEDWGRHPSSTQHLVSRLAADRDLIWVNSIGMRRPRLDGKDLRRAAIKLARMAAPRSLPPESEHASASAFKAVPDRVSILSPHAVSWPGNPVAGAFNRASLGRQVRAEISRRSLKEPILWTSLPTALPVIGALGERGVAYYCGDDFSAMEGVDNEPVAAMEQALSERADMILACSEQLAAQFPPDKTRLLPHGVDLDLFGCAASRPADMPAGTRIAGFFGGITDRLDFVSLRRTATSLPDWTFVMIGDIRADISALAGCRNIVWLGPKPFEKLGAYARHWTVSIYPVRDTAQIRAGNPLKLREYLAVGAPIVTPWYPAMDAYRDMLQLYEYGADFSAAILAAAADTERNALRRQSMRAESWDARARQASLMLEEIGH